MTLTKQGNFSFLHASQQDDLYKGKSALEIKQAFDSQANELKNTLNTLIDSLTAQTAAADIGVASISGLSGNTVQALLQSLKNQVDSTVLGNVPDGSITDQKLSINSSSPVRYAPATGTANAYTVTLTPAPTSYFDGMAIAVKINADSTGASTLNVNGLGAKSLKKASGLDATNLKTNGVYTFRYNSSTGNFILQGEGGSGTATAGDILTGKTASTDSGDVTGTMNDRGAMTITPGTTDQIIPAGFHNGTGKVVGDPALIAANILSTAKIFNVQGIAVAGKRTASGTVTSSNTAVTTYSHVSGATAPSNFYPVSVSGLTFLPKKIILFTKIDGVNSDEVVYRDDTNQFYQKTVLISRYRTDSYTNGAAMALKADASGLSVTSTAFTLPCDYPSTSYSWEAYE